MLDDVYILCYFFCFITVITGFEYKGVVSAYTQINLLVLNVRKQLPKTHFISLPLSSPEIKAKFIEFQKQLTSSNVSQMKSIIMKYKMLQTQEERLSKNPQRGKTILKNVFNQEILPT